MESGLLSQWRCPVGEWQVWAPDGATRAAMVAAPPAEAVPSFIQEDHLRSGEQDPGTPRRVFTTFTIHERFSADVMGAVFTELVRAHAVFHTAFVPSDGGYQSRTLRADQVELAVVATSATADPGSTLKDHLVSSLPRLSEWAAFAFAVTGIEHAGSDAVDPRFTVVVAADHLFTDGVSQAVMFLEILSRYSVALTGQAYCGPASRPYPEFAAEQRSVAATLCPAHPGVVQWRDVVARVGGMPTSALPLGLTDGESALGEIVVHPSFLDPTRTAGFASLARRCGGSTGSALLALMAEIDHSLTGAETFTMMVPLAHRTDPADVFSVGWFATLVPVQFASTGPFEDIVGRAHAALRHAKKLERLPIFPVIDLLAADDGFPVEHGFAAPMLSYIDVTRVPGAELAHRHGLAVFADPAPMREVFVWINRDESGLDFNAMFPGTPAARAAVEETFTRLRDRVHDLTATSNGIGDERYDAPEKIGSEIEGLRSQPVTDELCQSNVRGAIGHLGR